VKSSNDPLYRFLELQNIIDKKHMEAFGMTRNERREKLKREFNGAEIDWEIYDIPAIHRQY